MDVLAGPDVAMRKADNLAIFFHRRPVGKLDHCDFVSGVDVLTHAQMDRAILKLISRFYGALQYRDAVRSAQQNGHIMKVSLRHSRRVRFVESGVKPTRESEHSCPPQVL